MIESSFSTGDSRGTTRFVEASINPAADAANEAHKLLQRHDEVAGTRGVLPLGGDGVLLLLLELLLRHGEDDVGAVERLLHLDDTLLLAFCEERQAEQARERLALQDGIESRVKFLFYGHVPVDGCLASLVVAEFEWCHLAVLKEPAAGLDRAAHEALVGLLVGPGGRDGAELHELFILRHVEVAVDEADSKVVIDLVLYKELPARERVSGSKYNKPSDIST